MSNQDKTFGKKYRKKRSLVKNFVKKNILSHPFMTLLTQLTQR